MIVAIALAAPAARAANDVCYNGGPTLASFKVNGGAHLDGTSAILTDNAANQNGSVMYQTPLGSTSDFHVKASVRITTGAGAMPADGMAFLLHNGAAGTAALGEMGQGLGYGGITPSVAVELDTFQNAWDPAGAHIAITRGGEYRHNAAVNAGLPAPVLFSTLNPAVDPSHGTPFFVWIDYTAALTKLDVYVAAADARPAAPTLTTTLNLAAALGPSFTVGVTGSTDAHFSQHALAALYLTDNGAAATAGCCTDNASCATSLSGRFCDPSKHVCGACSFGSSDSCPFGDKACNLSLSHNACTVPCNGNFGAAATNPCPSAAYPFCRTAGAGAGSCAACSGDAGTGGGAACAAGSAPVCTDSGYCGVCSTNADCMAAGATHAGGFCNGAGACVGTCAADGDCGPGNACLTPNCVAKGANGAAIPGGSCTAPLGARLCVSGVCSADNTCGIVSGQGPCTAGNAATVCQSGVCSAGNVCIPAASGACAVDADCAAGLYCDRGALMCKAKLANGTAIPATDGLHDGNCTPANANAVCASDQCNATTKTCAGPNGGACAAAGECVNNVCGGNSKCGNPDGTAGCTPANAATFCQSANCNSGVCVPGGPGSCLIDAECAAGTFCKKTSFACTPKLAPGDPIPNDGLHNGTCGAANAAAVCASGACNVTANTCGAAVGAGCADATDCANNICGSNKKCGNASGSGACTPASAPQICQSGACGLQSKVCIPSDAGGCGGDADCAANQFCDAGSFHCAAKLAAGVALPADGVHNVCPAGNNTACASGQCNGVAKTCGAPSGTACANANQCALNVCGDNGKCGLADGQAGCTTAAATLCQTGVCSASGVCGTTGCAKDADCPATAYCNGTTGLCQAKLAAGQALPSDGIHDGSCSPASGQAICASGGCNPISKVCALPVGATCTGDVTCANGICADNGRCGHGDGEGPCDAATQATVCQSGACNTTTLQCQPTGAGHCTRDADCDAASFCDRTTFSCAAKLAVGSEIPSDGIHDGTCNSGTAVCASGLCNQAMSLCAAPNGQSCTAASACATNICFDDHLCGSPDAILCATPAECRSNLCTDGVCGPGPAPGSVGGSGGCSMGGGALGEGALACAAALSLALTARRRRRARP
ncbi:MAG TPA: L-type lectin-domain containing protein [Polyangia bacterium]|nr:L-type lectin-domain containing protein [Polyangia bacterium]